MLYPQFIYESVLKTATGKSDLSFTVTTEPFPVLYIFSEREDQAQAFDLCFLVGIGLSLLPVAMVGFILREREQ